MSSEMVKNYTQILSELKTKIKQSQLKATLAVNSELLSVYWEIGNTIKQQQELEGWGTKIIDRLATDLKSEFPQMQGLSTRNIKYMRAFAEAYPYFPFVQEGLAQISNTSEKVKPPIVQVQLAQLPWYHHITLIEKVKDLNDRIFYIKKTLENGWSRNIMVHQIESGLHKRQGALSNNFKNTLPAYDSELATDLFKDPYHFDWIGLGEKAREKDLEQALSNYIYKFLTELGEGFAFMGKQRRFEVGGRDFIIDMLFYHTKLRRHIIIELKIGEFEPEYVSKMNTYLGIVDDLLKGEYDNPSLGLILCKNNNKVIAEYALRDTSKPIGIAEYKLAQILPDEIRGELPTIEEIETNIANELIEPENTIKSKLTKLKERISSIKTKDAIAKNTIHIREIYEQFFIPFFLNIKEQIDTEFLPLFNNTEYYIFINNAGSPYHTSYDFEKAILQYEDKVTKFELSINLRGFKKAGTEAFDTNISHRLTLENYRYKISYTNNSEDDIIKLYSEIPTIEEKNRIMEYMLSYLIDTIEKKIEKLD